MNEYNIKQHNINKHTANKCGNKNRHIKLLSMVLLCVCTLTLLCGCQANPKNFSVSNMTITLTDNFEIGKADIFDIYIKSDDVIFTAVEETTSELEYAGYEISSLADYADEIAKLNNAKSTSLQTRNNYKYFVSKNTVSGASYTYVHCILKNADSYWVCEFACKTKNYDKLKDDILEWADSITFN